jgi:endonuclease III
MKKDAQFIPRLKQLVRKIKKIGGAGDLTEIDDPMELLLWSILANYASEARATAAVARLQAAMVDYNELRVTPVAEIVEIIGTDCPMCRPAAQEISRTLSAIFNRLHHLNLAFLKTGSRRAAESFLNNFDGVGAHAKAMMILRCLKGHAIPLDVNMHAYLRRNGYVAEDAPIDHAQRLLAGIIKEREALGFYGAFKRFAAAHAPRKGAGSRPSLAATAKMESKPTEPITPGARTDVTAKAGLAAKAQPASSADSKAEKAKMAAGTLPEGSRRRGSGKAQKSGRGSES